jgi:hypothetical protein
MTLEVRLHLLLGSHLGLTRITPGCTATNAALNPILSPEYLFGLSGEIPSTLEGLIDVGKAWIED